MRVGVIGLLLILTHIIESTLFQYIRIGNISPSLMITIIISFALLRGSKEGALIGFAAGLLYDATFGLYVVELTIPYTLVGYLCGKLNKDFYRENFILPFVCSLAGNIAVNLWIVFLFMMKAKVNFSFYFTSLILPEVIYTITISLIVYQMIYMINDQLEIREKKKRSIF